MEYVYTYACHEDEQALCHLELRTLLGAAPQAGGRFVRSTRRIDPSRSPFLKLRLEVQCSAGSLEGLAEQAQTLTVKGSTFKVVFAETDAAVSYDRQREIERELGRHIRGKADMRRPEQRFAATLLEGRWLLGEAVSSEALWLRHQQKPQNYSTALSTRVARAVVNIAVPEVTGTQAIDPCCGIGTVLVEAMSMGIDIVGVDLNPLAVRGARVNLDHFGMPSKVSLADMRTLTGRYDALILDMPYNLCSKLPEAQQLEMLQSASRLAKRAVIISTEPIDRLVEEAGFRIVDGCIVHKSRFSRQLWVAES
ncbi:TRM11 family SAM-dependent methyltransferase [Paenibacillus hexagrammi]|uniref:RsmD family RNA methyltransferase n=1 Tax=Paenibacillus hexagrammi TaxID=2908839 RepID=A0ABY3SIX9_9BACL|nr:RsmD family RNA methyltransferase [Paenibacillus sp. YPD9-1]UJF32937.1 RsmD family RNA methyltransferase [Paenibacillus sp. YPD9-1]